eukprot:TRINITY_DN5458_c0_g1_i1.p3 TRINITY_DN5458_c0_g1~~TRINITY_DN5458_c0_g1_i1.p3  ORF type:complete len:204 (-),score=12.03 TRINITY_DN5458_c0_g1_i1:1282-1893(-)
MISLLLIICSYFFVTVQGSETLCDNISTSQSIAAKLIGLLHQTPEVQGIVNLNEEGVRAFVSACPTQNCQSFDTIQNIYHESEHVQNHRSGQQAVQKFISKQGFDSDRKACTTRWCKEQRKLEMCSFSSFERTQWCQNIMQSAYRIGTKPQHKQIQTNFYVDKHQFNIFQADTGSMDGELYDEQQAAFEHYFYDYPDFVYFFV